jgi:hypothetical protein
VIDFSGCVAVVTWAARGIGRATARHVVREALPWSSSTGTASASRERRSDPEASASPSTQASLTAARSRRWWRRRGPASVQSMYSSRTPASPVARSRGGSSRTSSRGQLERGASVADVYEREGIVLALTRTRARLAPRGRAGGRSERPSPGRLRRSRCGRRRRGRRRAGQDRVRGRSGSARCRA